MNETCIKACTSQEKATSHGYEQGGFYTTPFNEMVIILPSLMKTDQFAGF
jgi:hypothetical protein